MFDGAAVATVDTIATQQLAQAEASPDDVTTSETPLNAPTGEPQFNSSDQALFDALAAYDTSAARQEIVFLSPSVRDYQQLLDGISPNVEVIILDPTRDGVEQMAEVLAGRTGVDAVHLISHGAEGQLSLGTGTLNTESMTGQYADEFMAIRQALADEADILIYGCNFAGGEAGQQAVSMLAELTGADVQASTDLTGHAVLGGDWDLEYQVGMVDTESVSSYEWQGVLATITVTTTLDENNGNTTSIANLQSTPGGSGISLREAVIAANNTAGNDTIILGAGTYTLTITGTGEDGSATGDLDIQTNVTITGAGMASTIINGGGLDRVMEVDGTGNLTMSDVRLTGGSINNDGGGLLVEESGGAATLTRVDITGNTITGGGRFGGGVHNVGTLIMDSSLVRGNTATGSDGGGISNIGTATITRSSIFSNTARYGGGIHQSSGTMTVENTTISGNTASLEGGGVDVVAGTATLKYSTIASNTAASGPGGGANRVGGTLAILSSIFADNSSTTGGRDLRGTVSSSGFNIIEHNTGFSGTVGTDQLGSDPLLAALALDASSGQYVHGLNTGSIAINTAGGTAPSTDQRGFLRTGTADVGAFEVSSGPAITTSFQNGNANGFGSNVDTYVDAGNVTANNATNVDLQVDLDDGAGDPTTQTLIRFDDLFGTGPGQIPYGSYITSASLTVNVNNVSDPGATIGLHAMLSSWTDTSNWSSLSGGVSTNGVEAAVTADSVLASPAATGSVTFTGLASRLQSWVSGGSANQGWVVVSNSTNGWDFDSSESANKPLLSVSYIAPGSQTSVAHSLTVDTAADILDGDATSIDALLANKGADGLISLREAIHAANNTANVDASTPDAINFAIGSGAQTIAVGAGGLPSIRDAVNIDARTQPGYTTTPLITLDGSGATGSTAGLLLHTNNSTISGFIVQDFPDEGIEIDGSTGFGDNNVIQDNWVGINAAGGPAGNVDNGILVTDDADNNIVRNNVVGSNGNDGIVIRNTGSDNNWVYGNIVGLAADGTTVRGNTRFGVYIHSTATGNTIGTNDDGTNDAAERNIISGNLESGVVISHAGNVIRGNYIGTDLTGMLDRGNLLAGIVIDSVANTVIGGTTAAARNVISGNNEHGITLWNVGATGTLVAGNYIGVDAAGTGLLGNTNDGIAIGGGASGNTIGGITPGHRNIISGNLDDGIELGGSGVNNNIIFGNYIGTDYTGTVDLGNTRHGVVIYNGVQGTQLGGSNNGEGNLISGNNSRGVVIDGNGLATSGNVVAGNRIGTDVGGTNPLGNTSHGIHIFSAASGNTIGGTAATAGNIIGFNGGVGVTLDNTAGSGNSMLGNSFNGNTGLGIDLGNDGITLNDGALTGGQPNLLIDFPVFTSVQLSGTTLTVSGYVGAAPGDTDFANVRVELFRSSNEGTHGEGQAYLGFLTTDANGNFSSSLTVAGLTGTDLITATATDGSGNTSEFGPNTDVNVAPVNTAPGAQSVNEDTALALGGISVNDVDGNLSTVQLSVLNGILTVSLAGGATISAGANSTNTLTLAGTQVQINAALATLTYQGTLNFNGADTLTVLSTDSNAATDSDTVAITVMAVNDEPTLTATGGNPTFTEDGAAVDLFSGVTASTVEAGQTLTRLDFTVTNVTDGAAERITVDGTTIQLTNGTSGTTATNSLSYTVTVASGTATVSLTQGAGITPAQMQTLVDGMTYQHTSQDPTAATRVVTLTRLDDNGSNSAPNDNTATLSLVSTVTVTAQNDPPTITAIGDQTIPEDGTTGALAFSVSDVETAAGSLTVTAASSNTTIIPNGNLTLVDLGGGNWTIAAVPALNQFGGPVTITVTVNDGTTSTNETFDVTVTAQNDPPVVAANTGSTVARGGTDVITNVELQITDVDNTPAQLTYTVTTGPVNGRLELTTAPGLAITSFTQAQLNAGQVVYAHDGSFTASDSFTFTASDGAGGNIGATTFGITVSAVNSVPSLAANTGSTVTQGLTDVLIASELQVVDLDNSPSQLVYTVTTVPANGQLELTTGPGVAITSFTQADIDAGRVVFVHSGAAATSDSFTFTVSDGAGGTIGATTFTLTVAPFIPPPGGGGGSGGGGGGGGGTGGSGGTGSGSGSGGSGGVVPPSMQPPPVPIGMGVPVKDAPVVGATNDPLPRAMSPNRTFARVEQPTVGIQEPPARPAEPFSFPMKRVLAVGHKLVEHLTKLADDLERGVQEREHKAQLIGQVASFSGMALSAGFVAWILRGGALVASFLVSMPAWRHFDPLPVLGGELLTRRNRDRKMREDDEQERRQFRGLDRVLRPSDHGSHSQKRDS